MQTPQALNRRPRPSAPFQNDEMCSDEPSSRGKAVTASEWTQSRVANWQGKRTGGVPTADERSKRRAKKAASSGLHLISSRPGRPSRKRVAGCRTGVPPNDRDNIKAFRPIPWGTEKRMVHDLPAQIRTQREAATRLKPRGKKRHGPAPGRAPKRGPPTPGRTHYINSGTNPLPRGKEERRRIICCSDNLDPRKKIRGLTREKGERMGSFLSHHRGAAACFGAKTGKGRLEKKKGAARLN